MTEIHHYDAQGRPRDAFGNLIEDNIVGAGQSIRVPLTLMDEQQREVSRMNDAKQIQVTMTPAGIRKAIAKHLPDYRLVRKGEENDPGHVQGRQAVASAEYEQGRHDGVVAEDRLTGQTADSLDGAMADYERKLTQGYRQ